MLKFLTILLLIVVGPFIKSSQAQTSFQPLEYERVSVEMTTESDEVESCEVGKAYIQSYFEKVKSYNSQLQKALFSQASQINSWLIQISVGVDKKIYYKKNSFLALDQFRADLSGIITSVEESSYLLSEDGFIILDEVLPECFEDVEDDLYENFEVAINQRLDISDIYVGYMGSIVKSVGALYENVKVLETKKEYFGDNNLFELEKLADPEQGFVYAISLYQEIIDKYKDDEEKILKEL